MKLKELDADWPKKPPVSEHKKQNILSCGIVRFLKNFAGSTDLRFLIKKSVLGNTNKIGWSYIW